MAGHSGIVRPKACEEAELGNIISMNINAMGQVGLTGVRGRAIRRAAPAIAQRTPLEEDQVLAIVGWVLIGLYAWGTFRLIRSLIEAGRTATD